MVSEKDLQQAVNLINDSHQVLITTHIRPDGDACGSMVAMQQMLTALDKKARLLLLSPLPDWYEFLFDEDIPLFGQDVSSEQLKQGEYDDFDLIVLLDVNNNNQLPGFCEYLKQNEKKVLVIDHHVTSDALGDVELLDTTAAATGLIVYDLFRYADWPITKQIAKNLFVAVATDTGWFQFNNTDGRVHKVCGELIEAGANPTEIYHDLYQNFSYQRFKLMVAMLNSLELHLDGRFAIQQVTQKDFQQSGAAYSDTENLIDECRRIGTVQAAVLLVETDDGHVRCSLRSTGAIDVRKIASKFGGGGHKLAAGAHLQGTLQDAKQLILREVSEQFVDMDNS